MILDEIIANKKLEIAESKKKISKESLKEKVLLNQRPAGSFYRALKNKKGMAVIAEIKKMSPSKGILREDFDPAALAKAFEEGGASALSVLTDAKYFGGSAEILTEVRRHTQLPILRKDFILEEYQLLEAKAMGADAVLLIAAVLSAEEMAFLKKTAEALRLDVLIEVHSEEEFSKVLPLGPSLIGINHRDLKTFHVDMDVTARLSPRVPADCLLVAESGIQTHEDLLKMQTSGAKAVLVGEGLMKEKDVAAALQRLLGTSHGSR